MSSEEKWLPIKEAPESYEVSSLGNVRSIGFKNQWGFHRRKGPKVLKPQYNYKGYKMVMLCIKNKKVGRLIHRLVAEAFIGLLDGKEVNHVNGIKDDNRVENLELCTHSENMQHAYHVLGIPATRQRAYSAKRKAIQCLDSNDQVVAEYMSVREAAEKIGHSHAQISIAARKEGEVYGFKWRYKQ